MWLLKALHMSLLILYIIYLCRFSIDYRGFSLVAREAKPFMLSGEWISILRPRRTVSKVAWQSCLFFLTEVILIPIKFTLPDQYLYAEKRFWFLPASRWPHVLPTDTQISFPTQLYFELDCKLVGSMQNITVVGMRSHSSLCLANLDSPWRRSY